MGHTSSIFERQPISVQNLNGFDLSHINCGTSKCGQLVPVLRKLLMQDSKISVGAAVNVQLPPLAAPFYGRVDFCIELFFVPCAILYGGWRQFISNQVATMFPASQTTVQQNGGYQLPLINFGFLNNSGTITPTAARTKCATLDGTNDGIADYLGMRVSDWSQDSGITDATPLYINMLPFLAYHKIVDAFYRNCTTTKTWFAVNPNWEAVYGEVGSAGHSMGAKNVSLVWHSFYADRSYSYDGSPSSSIKTGNNIFSSSASLTFPDQVSLLETRQRTYSRDYFTAGSVTPQQGNPGTLQIDINPGGEVVTGSLTVHGLRAIVALQRFEEKLNYDPSYRGIMRNLFGSSPKDALLDEPSYIGRLVLPVYQKSVAQTGAAWDSTSSDGPAGAASSNPYVASGLLGAKGASGSFSGEGEFCKNYKIGCFGYLMALASIVPHTMYGYGIDRELLATEIGDFPFPDLQTVGMDGTKYAEIYADAYLGAYDNTFNYLPRYSWMKYKNDEIHGEMRPGKTLDMFVLQRVFTQAPQFGTDFVTIGQHDLDAVFAVAESESKFTCWYEIYWVLKVVMPLAAFIMPTLGDLKDVHTITTTQGGSRL